MNPVLAKQIALGNVDPVTFLPMSDIDPSFVPRALKPLPLARNRASWSPKYKGKERASSATGGILSYFGWISLSLQYFVILH